MANQEMQTNLLNLDLTMNRENNYQLTWFIGDMIFTCKQNKSRNYQFGSLISDDRVTIRQAKEDIGTVEGYDCCITLVEKSTFSCEPHKSTYDILIVKAMSVLRF